VSLRRSLLILLPLDALCALVYLAHWHVAAFASDRWDLSIEGSYGEWLGHVIEVLVVAGLVVLWRRTRSSHLLVWALTYAYVAIDDTIQIHEHVGRLLIRLTGGTDAQFGIRTQDIGELVSWAIAGAVFATALYLTYRSAPDDIRWIGRRIAAVFAMLVFCGIVLDTVDRVIDPSWHQIMRVSVLAEDGGELLAVSLALAFVASLLERRTTTATSSSVAAAPPLAVATASPQT
jgi:hypothetical protein